MLPAQTLDAEELTGMRDKSGQAITPKAIKVEPYWGLTRALIEAE
jgi:hypothetical protein